MEGAVSYSQFGEDLIAQNILSPLFSVAGHGSYLDVGAGHPVEGSNTYLFYKRGWRGTVVDPLRNYHGEFAKLRPDDELVWAAVGPDGSGLLFHEFEPSVLSTCDEQRKTTLLQDPAARYLR